jgi:hypothetical protein
LSASFSALASFSPASPIFPGGAITHIRWDIGIPSTGETGPWDLWINELRFY